MSHDCYNAPAGKRVLVLEQNSYLGGGASTYQINGVDFDIGTYFVGQVSSVVERRQLDKQLLKRSFLMQVQPEMWTCVHQITEGQVTFVPFDDLQDRVYVGQENRISAFEDHKSCDS